MDKNCLVLLPSLIYFQHLPVLERTHLNLVHDVVQLFQFAEQQELERNWTSILSKDK